MSSTATATLPVSFRYYVPSAPLSEFVEVVWYWRGYEQSYGKERLMPMMTSELVIDLGSGQTDGAGISGPQSEAFIIERTSHDELLGIHFRNGGVFPFLDIPCGELHGRHLALADLWGKQRAGELVCRLHEARTIDMKFRVVEQWLLRVARRPFEHHPAVSFAIQQFQKDPGLFSSAAMADRVGFSQRHFIQLFRDEVGVTPKLFCRVQRFQQVIKSVQHADEVDWADVALSCGYFDQSHFNHDFRSFSGLRPTEYLPLRTSHTSHVRVRD